MKTLIRVYSACCLIVVGFFVFFSIPWGLLPFSDAVDVMLVGSVMTAGAVAIIVYLSMSKGFEFGHFIAHGGFWVIVMLVFGLLTLLCGTLLFVAPDLFEPAFEQGALPIGMLIVSLFWMALVFLVGFLAFLSLSAAVPQVRDASFKEALFSLAIGLFCLFLAGVFFSLYLDVLNDNVVRLPAGVRSGSVWAFAGTLAATAFTYGLAMAKKPRTRGIH